MADPATPAAPVVAPSEPPARFSAASLDKEFGEETPVVVAPPAASTPVAPPEPKPGTAPPVETPPEPTPEELKQLDAFLQSQAPEAVAEPTPEVKPQPPAPSATPEAAQLQTWASNPQFAKEAVQATRSMIELDMAASSGNVPGVLEKFAPAFQEALIEHIYQGMKEQFVQRFIDEHEGRPHVKPDPRVAQLEAKIEEITATQTRQQQDRQNLENDFRQRQSKQNYRAYWDNLFKAVGVTEAKNKNFLRGAVLDSLAEAADEGDAKAVKAIQQIRNGQYTPIGLKFREIYQDWHAGRKAQTVATEQVRAEQEGKKGTQLVATPAAETTTVPGQEPEFDQDKKRTSKFWERGLKKLGID